jgi:hypothetical protein
LLIAIDYVVKGGQDPEKVKNNGKRLGYIIIALIAKGLIYLTCYLVTGGQSCRF